jgi:hypothetical protein
MPMLNTHISMSSVLMSGDLGPKLTADKERVVIAICAWDGNCKAKVSLTASTIKIKKSINLLYFMFYKNKNTKIIV